MSTELKDAKNKIETAISDELDVAKTRLSEEIDAAKARLNEELTHAKAAVREATIGKVETMAHDARVKVRSAGDSVVATVKDNAIPLALIGTGLLWMLAGRRRDRRHPEQHVDDKNASSAMHGKDAAAGGLAPFAHPVSEIAQHAGDAIGSVPEHATVAHAAEEAGKAIVMVAHKVQDNAGHLARGVAERGHRVRVRTGELLKANPLAFGVLLVATGAAIGLAIPGTRTEDDLLGAASDQVMDKAEDLAHAALDKAGEAARKLGDGTMPPQIHA